MRLKGGTINAKQRSSQAGWLRVPVVFSGINAEGGLVGILGVAPRSKVGRGGAWSQQGPSWGRGTHLAGVAAAILGTSTNHVVQVITEEAGLL